MNPGASKNETISTLPWKIPTFSVSSTSKLPVDFPPMTGSFISAHLCRGPAKSSSMMMSPQFAQATSALASSPAIEGTTELARIAAAMSAERMVGVGGATMIFFFATGVWR